MGIVALRSCFLGHYNHCIGLRGEGRLEGRGRLRSHRSQLLLLRILLGCAGSRVRRGRRRRDGGGSSWPCKAGFAQAAFAWLDHLGDEV